MSEHEYGPWTIVIDSDGYEPDRPWQWQAYKDGVMLLEGEASFDYAAACRDAEGACRECPDDEEG